MCFLLLLESIADFAQNKVDHETDDEGAHALAFGQSQAQNHADCPGNKGNPVELDHLAEETVEKVVLEGVEEKTYKKEDENNA